MNETFYEVLHVYKKPNTAIEGVELVKINDESTRKTLKYEIHDNQIYLKTDDLHLDNYDFNIVIKFNDFEHSTVYASHPIDNKNSKFKNKSAKLDLESINKAKKAPKKPSYLTTPPSYIVTIKKANLYHDVNFTDQVKSVAKGNIVEIVSIEETVNKTPRLITRDGYYISANTDIFTPVNLESFINEQSKQTTADKVNENSKSNNKFSNIKNRLLKR